MTDEGEVFARIRPRLAPAHRAGVPMLAEGKRRHHAHPYAGQSDYFRRLRQLQLLKQKPRRRRLIARIAARARWRNGHSVASI
jgi:hypothetical protein